MTDILVYTEEQGNVIAGSVQPDRMTVAVLGAVGGGTGGGGAVSSVNGQTGVVVLDAADVGADPAGTGASTAASAVAAHEAALDPHPQYTTAAEASAAAPVQSVNGETGVVVLSATDVGADVAGAAASAVAAHVADTTPHDVITHVDRFGFDTAAGLTAGVGELVWNAADGTVDLGLPGGVTLQVGQEQLIRVLNKTGSTIQNMHVVYITGAQGNRVTAAQAQANSASADKTLAVATQDIANNAEGFATILGMVRQVNTSAWAEGTELWLSAATPGAITNVRPSAPNHQVRVGYVVRSHATQGVIYVTVNIGSDLNHLHDVVITAPADNDVLVYDSATQTWQNGPQTGGSGEVNTASNLGSGAGVFASKVGADLQFKSLVAGSGVTLTPTGTTITITTSGAGGAVDSVNGQTGVVVLDTDDVAEGATNLYHTTARAAAAAPVQSVNGQTGAVDLSGSYAPLSHVGSGGTAHANVVAGGAAGFMTGADKTKLDGIAAGAQVNVPTDLSLGTVTNTTIPLNSSTGTDVTLPAATTSTAGLLSGTDKTKLDSVQSGAVAPAQVVEYTGTAKTLALTDINTVIDCTSGSAVTITIPPQSSVTWTAAAEIHVRMSGTGTVSIAVGSGVTIPPLAAPIALSGQGAMVTLKRRSSDVWAVVGSVVGGPDVVGPASSVDNEIARFDGATGKKLKAGLKYQASASDATPGALMIVGAANIFSFSATNGFDTLSGSRFLRAGTDGPLGSTICGGISIGVTSTIEQQIAGRQGRVFFRSKGDTVGDAWVEFFHAGNVSAFIQTLLPAADALSARATLGVTKQTSVTDTTAGSLVIQGGQSLVTSDAVSVGFGTGAGGAVTQATSKATGVTLNKPSGQITMNAAALAANTAVSFTLTNSAIAANDVPKVVIKSGATAGAYVLTVDAVAAGSCRISVRNMTGGSLSEALVLQFNVEKGAIA